MMRALLSPLVALLAAGTYLFGIAGVGQHAGAANGDFGSISGVVTADAYGQPLEGICVDAWGPEHRFDWTDAGGAYTIQDLPTGEYGVVFSDCQNWPPIYATECYHDKPCGSQTGDLVLVTPGANVTGIDAGLPKTGSISGIVTDEATGEPLEGICVSAASNLRDLGQTVSDSSGSYRIVGAYEEPYRVHFVDCSQFPRMYTEEYFDGAPDYSSADLVPVTWGNDTPDIDASLLRVGSISGVVSDDATEEPLEGMCVTAIPAYLHVETDSAGHFTIDTLDAGDYTLVFGDCANNPALYVTEWFDNRPNCQPCDSVHVAPGAAVVGVDAALAKGGAISGTVTDEETGGSLYGAGVEVYDLSGVVRQSTFTNSQGQYTIHALPEGQYKVRFSHNYGGLPPHWTEWYNDKPDYKSADAVNISPGTISVVDTALAAAVNPAALTQGDVDCNGSVTSVDALNILRSIAHLAVTRGPGCPLIGSDIGSLWGDVDCSDQVDSVDPLKVLRWVTGLPIPPNESCPRIGDPVGN